MHLPHHSFHYHNYLQTLHGRLVASFTIRDFVASMTSFLVPVYMYSFGYSLKFIAIYGVVYFAVGQLVYGLAAKVIATYGLYHSIFISYIALALSNFLLLFADNNVWFIYASAPALLLSTHLFWPARHIDIARVFKSGRRMRHTTSVINSLSMFVAAIAPLFGGLLAARFGPAAALFAAFVIMILATGLLITEYQTEQGEPVVRTLDPKYRRPLIGNMAKNFESYTGAVIWPLFVFFLLEQFETVGLIASVSFSVGVLVTYASGNWFGRFPYFWTGTIIRTLSFPFRVIASTAGIMLGADLVGSLGSSAGNSRFMSRYYNHAVRSGDIDSFVFTMEKGGDLAKLAVWALMLICLLVGTSERTALASTFVAAAIVTPFSAFIGNRRHE